MANTTWSTTDKVNTTLSGGDLIATGTAVNGGVRSAHSQTTGKYYWELTPTTLNQTSTAFGIANASANLASVNSSVGINACFVSFLGNIFLNGFNTGVDVNPNLAANVQIGCALDLTAKRFWLRSAPGGVWNAGGSADPATGIGGVDISSIAAGAIFPLFCWSPGSTERCSANFGASAFAGAVPSGFTAGFPDAPPVVPGANVRVMVLA